MADTTIDDLLIPQTTAVYLTKEELTMLRGGLSAYTTSLSDIYGQTAEVREEQAKYRELNARLYAASVALGGR